MPRYDYECAHIRNKLYSASTAVSHKSIAGRTHAELDTETKLCAICSGLLVTVLRELEGYPSQPPPPLHEIGGTLAAVVIQKDAITPESVERIERAIEEAKRSTRSLLTNEDDNGEGEA